MRSLVLELIRRAVLIKPEHTAAAEWRNAQLAGVALTLDGGAPGRKKLIGRKTRERRLPGVHSRNLRERTDRRTEAHARVRIAIRRYSEMESRVCASARTHSQSRAHPLATRLLKRAHTALKRRMRVAAIMPTNERPGSLCVSLSH